MDIATMLLILALIFGGQTLGCIIGLLKKPGEKNLYASLALAGSMMICVSFFELVPGALAVISLPVAIASFLGGILLFEVIDHTLPHIHPELLVKDGHGHSVRRSAQTLLIGMAIHNVPEGLAVAAAFAADPMAGLLVAVTISLQDIPENIATIVPLSCIKCRKESFKLVMYTAFFELGGFLGGLLLLGGASHDILGISLAMAAGVMVYISMDELLPSAQIGKDPKRGVAALLLGALAVAAMVVLIRF